MAATAWRRRRGFSRSCGLLALQLAVQPEDDCVCGGVDQSGDHPTFHLTHVCEAAEKSGVDDRVREGVGEGCLLCACEDPGVLHEPDHGAGEGDELHGLFDGRSDNDATYAVGECAGSYFQST